jgi:hypothetical protein
MFKRLAERVTIIIGFSPVSNTRPVVRAGKDVALCLENGIPFYYLWHSSDRSGGNRSRRKC